jgi:hypothetical protein
MNKILQAPQISLAAIKALANGYDNVTINISQNAIQYAGKTDLPMFDPGITPMEEERLLTLLDSFPSPKILYFMEYLRLISIRKFGNKTKAAKWLGMSKRRVRPTYKKLERRSESVD